MKRRMRLLKVFGLGFSRSIRKLVRLKNTSECMVKLNNKKIKWAIRKIISKEKTTKEISEIYDISQRRVQMLVKKYHQTGEYPKLNRKRRPKTNLSDEQKELIDKGYSETFLEQ